MCGTAPPVYDCDGCAVLALLPPLGRDGCASLALLPPLGCDGCAVLAPLPHLVRGGCTNVRASARAPQTLSAREQRAANKEAGAVSVLCCVVQFIFFVLLCWSADLGRYSRCLIISPNVCAPSNDCDGCAVLPPPVYDCDGCAVLALGRDGCALLPLYCVVYKI